jgi:hypothetical protein
VGDNQYGFIFQGDTKAPGLIQNPSTTDVAIYSNANGQAATVTLTLGQDAVLDAIINGTSSTLSLDAGTPATSATNVSDVWTTGTYNLGNFPGGGFGFPGWLYEYVVYDHVLSSGNRSSLQTYFNSLYGQP